ncbi:MAG TPA: substrate-binding domain-containing protein [Chthoniobacterales bacterium]|jgi:LacI family transcriptional regulator|nr:substrate-binding domain-containing protein [Chthoniobacterales bacterium]
MNPAFFARRKLVSLQPAPAPAVGLIVSDVSNPFFAEVIPAIEECLDAAGFTTLLGNASEDCTREARLLKTMRECSPTGVLICPSFCRDGLGAQPLRLMGRLPTVAFARPAGGLDYVGVNNVYGTELAVDHLYENGHRKIAFVGGEPQAIATQERLEGYQRALTRRDLPLELRWMVPSSPNRCGGYRSTAGLLELENPPTAAVCFNDLVAFGLVQALQQAGRKPEAEFGVIGFNDVPVVLNSCPLLTTVDTSPRQLGEVAAELLLRRIAKPDSLLQKVILQPRLIVRHSCGTTY